MSDFIDIKSGTNVEVLMKCDLVASKTVRIDEQLMEIVYGKKPEYFIINMKNVEMVDSSGISLLLAMLHYLKEKGCPFSVSNLSADIYELFIRMRLDRHLEMTKLA